MIVLGKVKSKKMVQVSGRENFYVANTANELTNDKFVEKIRIEKCLNTNGKNINLFLLSINSFSDKYYYCAVHRRNPIIIGYNGL